MARYRVWVRSGRGDYYYEFPSIKKALAAAIYLRNNGHMAMLPLEVVGRGLGKEKPIPKSTLRLVYKRYFLGKTTKRTKKRTKKRKAKKKKRRSRKRRK